MKTDLYTKIVLTVIAISLTGILLKDITFVSKAQAIPLPTDILSTQTEGVMDVNIVQINGQSVLELPVKVNNFGEMPRDIKNSNYPFNSGTLPVSIENSSNSPVPVEVTNTVTVQEK